MSSRSTSNKVIGLDTEDQELDRGTHIKQPIEPMDLDAPPSPKVQVLLRPAVSFDMGTGTQPASGRGRKRKLRSASPVPRSAEKEPMELSVDEEHMATLEDGMIICPKCGEELRVGDPDGEDEDGYSDDEDEWATSDDEWEDVW